MLNVHEETAQEFMACMKATIILRTKNGHQKMENNTIRLPTAMPDWEKEPLDPERPALAQFEEKVLQAEDPQEFDLALEWLDRKYYRMFR
jgi:hypothetical protein